MVFEGPRAPPAVLNVDAAQRLAQKRPGPAPETRRGRLVQQLQYPLVRRRRVERLFARTRLVLQPGQPVIGVAMPPTANNPRLNADLFGYPPRAPTVRLPQHNPGTLHTPLHPAAPTANSLEAPTFAPP